MKQDEDSEIKTNTNLEQVIAVRHLDRAGERPGMETSDSWRFARVVQQMADRNCGRKS